jgi:hypothetical protein
MSNGDVGTSADRNSAGKTAESQRIAEAKELARKHYEIEEGLKDVFLLDDRVEEGIDAPQSIKLLEVNENTVAAGIVPVKFSAAPSSGVNFPSVIVEVTPAEFQQIQAHQLPLPDGWVIGERIPPPVHVDR